MARVIISETQQRIIDAFFIVAEECDNPQKITMKKIADKAGIKRQNIYKKHFSNIDDLLNTIHRLINWECEEKFEEFPESGSSDLLAYFAQEILPLLYDKRDWLKILYGTTTDSSWAAFLQKSYTPYLRNYLTHAEKKTGLSADFLCSLVVRQIIALVANWLTSEHPEPASLFKKKFMYCVSTSTYDLINL